MRFNYPEEEYGQVSLWQVFKRVCKTYRDSFLLIHVMNSWLLSPFSTWKVRPWVLKKIGCHVGKGVYVGDNVRVDSGHSDFPAKRDLGGFERFGASKPTLIHCNGAVIKEFPISTTKIFGREMVYSGGGYFRFFPLGFVKIPGTLKNRYLRYIKSNIGRKLALGKLQNLLSTESFVNLAQADHI